ncbi:MAG: tetratricopeptide repeat protein [Bdellovibrionota bacterium]
MQNHNRISSSNPSPTETLLVVALLVSTVFVWAMTLGFGFVWDDWAMIHGNPSLLRLSTLWRGFGHDFWALHAQPAASGYWRPLVTVVHVLLAQLFGVVPWGFHAASVLFHVANVHWVYRIARNVGVSMVSALAIGAWFAIYPMNVETVSFASALPDLMYAFFGLGAIYFYTKPGTRSWVWIVSLLGLSLLSKEMGISFVLWIGCMEWGAWKNVSSPRPKKTPWIWIVGMCVVYGMAHMLVTHGVGMRAQFWGGSAWTHIGTVVKLFGQHLFLVFVPFGMSPTRDFDVVQGMTDLGLWAGLVGMAIYAGAVQMAWKTPSRHFLLGFLCFWLPVSNLLPAEGLIADRYVYMMGPCVWLALFLWFEKINIFAVKGFKTVYAFLLVLMLAYGLRQMQVWESDESLWSYARLQNIASPVALNEWGNVMLHKKDLDRACAAYQSAWELRRQEYDDAFFNLVLCRVKNKQPEQAQKLLAENAVFSNHAEYWDLMAMCHQEQNDLFSAWQAQQKAIEINPSSWKYDYHAGLIQFQSQNFDQANQWFSSAVRKGGTVKEVAHYYALSFFYLGDYEHSIDIWKQMQKKFGMDPLATTYIEKAEQLRKLQAS